MPGIIIPSLKFEWPKFGANKVLSSGAKMITYFFIALYQGLTAPKSYR
jgi:hypothetical protein